MTRPAALAREYRGKATEARARRGDEPARATHAAIGARVGGSAWGRFLAEEPDTRFQVLANSVWRRPELTPTATTYAEDVALRSVQEELVKRGVLDEATGRFARDHVFQDWNRAIQAITGKSAYSGQRHWQLLIEESSADRAVSVNGEARSLDAPIEPQTRRAHMPEWTLNPGDTIERVQLHAEFGGRTQGEIGPSSKSPNVFVFTDPASGEQYGYIDSWRADGCFHYTGEGQRGDQQMKSGNRAILDHQNEGRALRLFSGARGTVRYEGEFVLDAEQPWYTTDAPEIIPQHTRSVIVFRMRPTDSAPKPTSPNSTSSRPPQESPRSPSRSSGPKRRSSTPPVNHTKPNGASRSSSGTT